MSKVRDLPENTTPANEDLLYVVDASVGPNSGRKLKYSTLRTAVLPTAAETKTLYESNANTNAFTDVYKNTLDTIALEFVTSVVAGRVVHYTGGKNHFNGSLYVTLDGDILLSANTTAAHLYVDVDGIVKQTGSNSPAPNLTVPIAKFTTDANSVVSLDDHRVFINRNLNAGLVADIQPLTPDNAPAAGATGTYADAEHVHGIETDAPSTNLSPATTNSEGVGTAFARNDHGHALDMAQTGDLSTVNAGDAEDLGSIDRLARADHQHPVETAPAVGLDPTSLNAEGNSTAIARANHTHAIATGIAGEIVAIEPDASANAGVVDKYARIDHRHPIVAGTPVSTGVTNAEGVSTAFARADHGHNTVVSSSIVAATADDTTASLTDVLLNSMTITPGAGTYLLLFGASSVNSGNGTERNYFSVYVNGVQVAATERKVGISGGAYAESSINTVVSPTVGQAVEIRWRVIAGTGTCARRSMTLVRLG